MSLPLVVVMYAISASFLVFFSIKCADYVDLMDKKTNLSGAFIGGVILAAVTSLPELVTSISSIYVVDNPELIIGNVLGSNIFNLCIFGALTAIAVRSFSKTKIGRSHLVTIVCTVAAYVLVAVTLVTGFGRLPVIHVNIASLVILVIYGVSLRFLSTDDSDNDEEDDSPLTVKQIVSRFVMMALGLVVMSIVVTYFTDQLQAKLNMGASIAGALFLGVATSLPELSSSIALVRHRNFNAMVGNVVGSNMFNLTIFSIADILAGKTIVFVYSRDAMQMIVFGVLSSVLVAVSILLQQRWKQEEPRKGGKLAVYVLLGVAVCVAYITSIVLP